jgi:thioredoxin reductase
MPLDPTSIANKPFAVEEHVPLVVIGAGPAGIAAAVEAARLGLRTMLIDEHPVAPALIGIDVPWMFGERMGAAVQNQARMLERIVAARPALQCAFDAGVDVRLGHYAWSAFVQGPTSKALPKPLLGLADEVRAWFVSFDRMIVAAGARDLALAFPGWDIPGVMGARGFAAATSLYGAFTGRRIAIIGDGAAAESVAAQARAAGIDIAATIVPPARIAGLAGTEVESVALADGTAIRCDTVVQAIDVIPVVEMFDLLGCATAFDGTRGGFVPVTDAQGRCSRPGIYAAGDCAGISDAALADPTHAEAAGRNAARAAAADAGLAAPPPDPIATTPGAERDPWRRAFLAAHAIEGSLAICRCEEVPLADLIGVRPPRYLPYNPEKFAPRGLRSLAAEGPLNQDQVKRLTRAGMGPCQGRRCREQVQALMAMSGNQPTASIPMPSYRAPLRPLPLSVLAAFEESAEMKDNWTAWFGIAAQWTPHWEPVPAGLRYETRWKPGVTE